MSSSPERAPASSLESRGVAAVSAVTPRVSFIVPLFNCLALTQAMLASLQATLPPDLARELIFVDDASSDGTASWLSSLSEGSIRVVSNPVNLGFAASCNRGAAEARGEILLFLNNDLVLTSGWIEPMLTQYEQLGDQAGVIGNVQRRVSDRSVDHSGIFINEKGKPEHCRELSVGGPLAWLRGWRSVDAVTGACLLISRTLWECLGGFDERFLNGCEDVDLCLRASSARKSNRVALRSCVGHHVSSSVGRKRRDEENTFRLTQKWRDTLAILAARRWCWHFLEQSWTSPREPRDLSPAIQALLHGLHLRAEPPAFALAGMQSAIDHEIRRWRDLGLEA